jgi:hypothetical protein
LAFKSNPQTNEPDISHLTFRLSKKIEKHAHALAVYPFHYHFCKIHKTLRRIPARKQTLAAKHGNLEMLWVVGIVMTPQTNE